MWKFLVILSAVAFVQGCRVIEQRANGVEVTRNSHSSHVLLEAFASYDQKYLCSGVIVSANYVLTTASCVFGAMFINVHVYSYQLRDVFENDREIYRSSEYIMKPEFDGLTHLNDVALIKLPSTLQISQKPYEIAQLPISALAEGAAGNTVGWGILNYKDDNAAATKQEQPMRVLSDELCRQAYPGLWTDAATKAGRACIMRPFGINCVGDSGSPFMVGDTVHGLLSFGQSEACNIALPNGIQEIFSHAPWIRSIIQGPQVLSLKPKK